MEVAVKVACTERWKFGSSAKQQPRRLGYRDEEKAALQASEDLWSLFEACRWLAAR